MSRVLGVTSGLIPTLDNLASKCEDLEGGFGPINSELLCALTLLLFTDLSLSFKGIVIDPYHPTTSRSI